MLMQDSRIYCKVKNSRNIVVLAEFPEGAWESVRFAMEKLIRPQLGLVLVQTYRKPDFGQSLLNNLTPVLERIARNELLELKNRTIRHYQYHEDEISVLPFEGDWGSFVRYGQEMVSPEFLVTSLKKSFPGAVQVLDDRLGKLAVQSTRPLFVLPDQWQEGPFERVLFLTATTGTVPRKIEYLSRLPFPAGKIPVDLRIISREKQDALPNFIAEYLHTCFGEKQFELQSAALIAKPGAALSLIDQLQPSLIVVDQGLVDSTWKGRKLKLKSWLENNRGVPLLIC